MPHGTIPPKPPITVSATYFVRHFAELRRAADHAPVYIATHGRPGWVLVSTDLFDAMTSEEPPPA